MKLTLAEPSAAPVCFAMETGGFSPSSSFCKVFSSSSGWWNRLGVCCAARESYAGREKD